VLKKRHPHINSDVCFRFKKYPKSIPALVKLQIPINVGITFDPDFRSQRGAYRFVGMTFYGETRFEHVQQSMHHATARYF
jgi:hypothetical protein